MRCRSRRSAHKGDKVMVFYKPHTDKQEIAALFPQAAFSENCLYGAYVALEAGKNCGKSLVRVADDRCEVSVEVPTLADQELIEGLLRASLHFAANRGAYIAVCRDKSLEDVLMLLGFTETDGVFSGEIPTLLQGHCCKSPNG